MSEIFLFSGLTKVELADFFSLVGISSLDRSRLSMISKDSWLVQYASEISLDFSLEHHEVVYRRLVVDYLVCDRCTCPSYCMLDLRL